MTANPAKTDPTRQNVVFVVYDNIVLLDLVGPLQVFSHARARPDGAPGYCCHVVGMAGGQVGTNTVIDLPVNSVETVAGLDIHTLMVVGGDGALRAMHNRGLVATIKQLAARAGRVGSVCSGALILAAAGLLDGRRAVTHWEDCATLANGFPQVTVEIDPIYVQDGPVWTSAGITAGIDMALAMVTQDLGRGAALEMARSMVTHMVRPGGQSQFSPVLTNQMAEGDTRFDALHAWIAENVGQSLAVDLLAKQAGMSPRNFSRVYTRTTGRTPAKAVEAIRVQAAQERLEATDQPMAQVAARCGFDSQDRMRRAFQRLLKVTPTEYRQNFRTIA